MIYIGFAEPHVFRSQWKVDIVNEFLLLTQFYYFLLYLGLVRDPDTLIGIGWAHVGHLGVLVLFNMSVILVVICSKVYRKCYLKKLAKKQKEDIKEMIEKAAKKKLETVPAKTKPLTVQPPSRTSDVLLLEPLSLN